MKYVYRFGGMPGFIAGGCTKSSGFSYLLLHFIFRVVTACDWLLDGEGSRDLLASETHNNEHSLLPARQLLHTSALGGQRLSKALE